MLIDSFVHSLALIALIAGSLTDLKTREVPDWLNYGLIFSGLGIRLIFSIAMSDYSIFARGILGLGAFMVIAFAMYYAGQWGGGDSKMLMGLGSVLGLELALFPFIFHLLLNIIIVGAVYGLVWSVLLMLRRWKDFRKEYLRTLKERQYVITRRVFMSISLLLLLAAFWTEKLTRIMMILIAFMLISGYYVLIFIKAVEKACMIRKRKVSELTIGDWVYEDVIVKSKTTPLSDLRQRFREYMKQEIRYSMKERAKRLMNDLFKTSFRYRKLEKKEVEKHVDDEIRRIAIESLSDGKTFRRIFLGKDDIDKEQSRIKKIIGKEKAPDDKEFLELLEDFNLYYGRRYIAGKDDLGLEEYQLKQLRKVKTVTLKEGIPFVPSFLAAYLLSAWIQTNIIFLLL